ncbi:GDSL-type esterase/lipase family protein [Cryocola sp. 340MFSha3.1]|uniref:GDSL-type esterase/lipase family protein n=1 Tax=Cryocola sp. 340MFSha3.1 TaxID=1169145 RepID=UPI000377A542|nr:GDSL-type esterase/lipase family protein [Cryocola sp. 340MFSha3.1]
MNPSPSARARHRLIRVGALVGVGVLAGLVAAGAAALRRFGRDDPTQYEGRVREQEERFGGTYPTGGVLLTGSSFFEFWTSSDEDLAPLRSTNIGIGGTKAGDHLWFFDRMVVPFDPEVLVVYVGSNDINGIPFASKPAADAAPLVLRYLESARRRLPDSRIYYVAITEAPARARVRGEITLANAMIEAEADRVGFRFIETSSFLLRPDGSIDRGLFGPDRLHFNARGYERFASAVRHGLQEELRSADADEPTISSTP